MVIDRMGRAILRGRWWRATAAQAAIAATRLLAAVICFGGWYWYKGVGLTVATVAVIALDWCAVSPLKWGIAAFYWQSIYRTDVALTACIAEAYRNCYRRALAWRLQLWMRGVGWLTVCGLPWVLASTAAERVAAFPVTPLVTAAESFLSVTAVLLLPMGWLTCGVIMLAYLPAVYLAVSGMTTGEAFVWSRKLMKGTYNRSAWYLCGFIWWIPLCAVAFLPFSAMWESGKAGLVYRRFRDYRRQIQRSSDGSDNR